MDKEKDNDQPDHPQHPQTPVGPPPSDEPKPADGNVPIPPEPPKGGGGD